MGIKIEASLDAIVSNMKKLFVSSSRRDCKDLDPKDTKEQDPSIHLKEKYQKTNKICCEAKRIMRLKFQSLPNHMRMWSRLNH